MAAAILLSTGDLATSQPPAGRPAAPELTSADLEAWLDGFVQATMRPSEIAGGVVVVVKNGAVLLQKGFGYSDMDRRAPVDPEETLFRLGSISKVVTATAVMQLVEEGKLGLDRDVNEYLDFPIPSAFGRAITLRHLLTHTAGFEETGRDAWMIDPARLQPLDQYLRRHLPRIVYPPGEVNAYSNYGLTLAGYIVQRTAGEPFEAYVERRIFAPLGMERSTFRQPVPQNLESHLSLGYRRATASPRPFEICAQSPAGSLSSTGSDIARFMIAHLQEGSYGDARILRPETARLMHTRVSDGFPAVNGMALGFRQADRNGHRIIAHGGDTGFFHSGMTLLLEDGVGFYVSLNSSGTGGDVRGTLIEAFIDRYFPAPAMTLPAPSSTALEHARQAAGRYETSRRWESSLLSVISLAQQVRVTANDDGTIVVPVETGPTTSTATRWREVEPFVWQEVGGSSRLQMQVRDGRVTGFKNSDLGSMVYLRSDHWRTSGITVPVVLGSVGLGLLAVIGWPLGLLLRRGVGPTRSPLGRSATIAHRLTIVGVVAGLATLVGWIALLSNLTTGNLHFLSESDAKIRVIQLLGLIGTAGAGAAVWNAWLTWGGAARIWPRLRSVLLAGACVGMAWFMWSFKLFTVRLTF